MRQPRPAIPEAKSEPRSLRAIAAGEDGVSLIEVVFSALLVGLIVIATLAGFDQTQRASVEEQRHAQADALAQQDQDRLRGLSVAALLGLSSNAANVTLDRQTYSIASSARFVSDSGGTPSCTPTGPSNADYIKTTSTVTWPSMGLRKPVVEESLIAPPAGGSLVVQVLDAAGQPVGNMSITATGTAVGTSSASAITSAAGCAIFGGLGVGPYTVSASQAGWVDKDWNPTPTQSASVSGAATAKLSFGMAQAGGIAATFATNVPGVGQLASRQDRFVAFNSGMTSPSGAAVGVAFQYQSTVTSSLQVFPTSYTLYAGSCMADKPAAPSDSPVVTVTPGQISTPPGNPPAPLKVPAVLVRVYSGTGPGNPGSLVNQPLQNITVTDGCGVKRRYSGTAVTAPTSPTGALTDPGEPFGALTVCVDANVGGQQYTETTTVNNTNYSTGTPANIYSGAAQGGVCA